MNPKGSHNYSTRTDAGSCDPERVEQLLQEFKILFTKNFNHVFDLIEASFSDESPAHDVILK
jgi:hypothetical protein